MDRGGKAMRSIFRLSEHATWYRMVLGICNLTRNVLKIGDLLYKLKYQVIQGLPEIVEAVEKLIKYGIR